jgi:hypothetical protein
VVHQDADLPGAVLRGLAPACLGLGAADIEVAALRDTAAHQGVAARELPPDACLAVRRAGSARAGRVEMAVVGPAAERPLDAQALRDVAVELQAAARELRGAAQAALVAKPVLQAPLPPVVAASAAEMSDELDASDARERRARPDGPQAVAPRGVAQLPEAPQRVSRPLAAAHAVRERFVPSELVAQLLLALQPPDAAARAEQSMGAELRAVRSKHSAPESPPFAPASLEMEARPDVRMRQAAQEPLQLAQA